MTITFPLKASLIQEGVVKSMKEAADNLFAETIVEADWSMYLMKDTVVAGREPRA